VRKTRKRAGDGETGRRGDRASSNIGSPTPSVAPLPVAVALSPARPLALLIDATAYLYRSYFAIRSLIGRDGSQVNALYGFTQTLLRLLEEWRPEYAAAAFDDLSAPTFRDALFSEYKRTRAPVPERLAPQFDLAMEASRALGVPALRVTGFEADDILATLVRRVRTRGIACLVVATDKDMAQLVAPGVWLYPLGKGEPMDAAAVEERYGVPPERIPDLLALRGDPVDCIPGVPGIGEKTARQLLATPGPVQTLWDDPGVLDSLGLRNAAAMAETLRQGSAAFRMGLELATLRDDVPLDLTDEALAYVGIDVPAVQSMCERFGFDRLRDRILSFNTLFRGLGADSQR
jgi:DNA polymerase-1